MGRVVHFEISADDTKRAVSFYKKAFGWGIENWGGGMEYWLVKTGEKDQMGIDGAIMPREPDSSPTINTIAVEDLDEAIRKIETAGGKRVSEKNSIPNIGLFCYCKDTEGNKFGILQPLGM